MAGWAACALPPPGEPAGADAARARRDARAAQARPIAIVAAERGPEGVRLVSVDEHGNWQFELVEPTDAMVRDTNPAVSPDGRWIAFVSSRGRSLDQTSLWIAPAGVMAPAHRLTDGTGIDGYPVWMPDGSAIVFASTRAHGNFELWRLAVKDGAAGALAQLTSGPAHEVAPTVAADGTIIYTQVTPDEQRHQVESHLAERAPDGTIRALTDGPADSSPAVSPDGTQLVFSRPQMHGAAPDADLWLMVRATGAAAPLIDLPLTDESGPVWSRDGRFVFATSVWRGEGGRVMFSSVIHLDVTERPPVARILEDRRGIVRLTPAIAAARLDAAVLHGDPEYLPDLARIMTRAIEQPGQGTP